MRGGRRNRGLGEGRGGWWLVDGYLAFEDVMGLWRWMEVLWSLNWRLELEWSPFEVWFSGMDYFVGATRCFDLTVSVRASHTRKIEGYQVDSCFVFYQRP